MKLPLSSINLGLFQKLGYQLKYSNSTHYNFHTSLQFDASILDILSVLWYAMLTRIVVVILLAVSVNNHLSYFDLAVLTQM